MSRLLHEIIEGCKNKGFTIIYASIESTGGFTVKWEDQEDKNHSFLQFAKDQGIMQIFIETYEFDFNYEISQAELSDQYSEMLSQSLVEYENHNSQTNIFDAYWFKEGVRYLYTMEEGWYKMFNEKYRKSLDKILALGAENSEKKEAVAKVHEQALDELSHKIAATDEYYQFSTRPHLLEGVILKKLSEWNVESKEYGSIYRLRFRTGELFNTHYKAKQDLAFADKLKALKEKDPKISKKAIKAQLQITEGIYDSIWHL